MTEKRSLSIRGHRTSISLEDAFWTELRSIAARRTSERAARLLDGARLDDPAASGDDDPGA